LKLLKRRTVKHRYIKKHYVEEKVTFLKLHELRFAVTTKKSANKNYENALYLSPYMKKLWNKNGY
jgi:hypothetical protein